MLDLFSVLVIFLIMTFISLITLFTVYWQYGKAYPGIKDWLYAYLLMTVGFMMIVMLDRIPYTLGMLISNHLLMIGLMFLHVGISRFFNRTVSFRRHLPLLGVAFSLYLVFTFVQNSLVLRNVVLTSVFIILFSQTLYSVFHNADLSKAGVKMSVTVFFMALLASLGRMVSLVFFSGNIQHYHNYGSTFEIATIIAYLTLVVLLLLVLLMLLANKMFEDVSEAEEKFKESFRLSPNGLMLYRLRDGMVVEANTAFVNMSGLSLETMQDQPIWDYTFWNDEARTILMKNPKDPIKKAEWTFSSSGGEKHVLLRTSVIRFDEDFHVLASFEDITTLIDLQESLKRMARHDPLTGLPNRRHFEEKYDEVIERTDSYALAFADIDNFKAINDAHGHEVGDEVLKELAKRIRRAVRDNDHVARFGGDEFIFLFETPESKKESEALIQSILEEIEPPLELGDKKVKLSLSIGVVHSDKKQDIKTIKQKADQAMYQSKDNGSYVFYGH